VKKHSSFIIHHFSLFSLRSRARLMKLYHETTEKRRFDNVGGVLSSAAIVEVFRARRVSAAGLIYCM
jgi:hypothetical protein